MIRQASKGLGLVVLALLFAGCGTSEIPTDLPAPSEPGATQLRTGIFDLPRLSELPDLPGAARRVSAADYELLTGTAFELSGTGSATHTPPTLELNPALSTGPAYAIFNLSGFPLDGSVYPETLTLERSKRCWLAVANFTDGVWQFAFSVQPGEIPLSGGADFLSPNGNLYVALIADTGPFGGAVTATSLVVQTNDVIPAPPGSPVPNLTVVGQVVTELPAGFTAAGTDPGDGAIADITYDWGDGTPVDITTDPLTLVEHQYLSTGDKVITLTVENATGKIGVGQFPVTVGLPFRELLVVYNSDIPESLDLANYYVSSQTGRAIDPAYVKALPLTANDTAISRAEYDSLIRDPLKAHLDGVSYKNTIKYIVLMKGVPYQVVGDGNDAVDSELCLLYANGNYDSSGRLWNGKTYNDPPTELDFNGDGFYEPNDGVNKSFTAFAYESADLAGGLHDVSYLVGRISAYTYDEAKASIDRSLNADTSGTGWVLMDTHTGWNQYETMHDPVWPFWAFMPPEDRNSLEELLDLAGYNNYMENTFAVLLPAETADMGLNDRIIGYCGWGVNHSRNGGTQYPSGKMYILQDYADYTYLPGAAWIVYESFAGQNFSWDGNPDNHNGQGQICDFIRMGGTVAAGNCFEPYTDGVPDERRTLERYLIHGDRWIEACYKGVRYFSWHTIVLGDPLCRVKP